MISVRLDTNEDRARLACAEIAPVSPAGQHGRRHGAAE